MLKKLFKLSCFAACFLVAGWFCRKQTDGFTLLKISSNLSFHKEWQTPDLVGEEKKEIQRILDQPFTYLAKGEQCFVFASQDQKYVLKFFRQSHMRAPIWIQILPPFMEEWKSSVTKKKKSKLTQDFASYKLAFEELKEETGLIYLHLNKTQDLEVTSTIVDKLGIAHPVSMDSMEFLLQKRAEPLYPAIEEFISQGKIEEAKAMLTGLVKLLMSIRAEKGILDSDPDLNINYGCIGITPVQIDIGRFKVSDSCKSKEEYKNEIELITDNLHQFLEARSQVLDRHLRGEIENLSHWE